LADAADGCGWGIIWKPQMKVPTLVKSYSNGEEWNLFYLLADYFPGITSGQTIPQPLIPRILKPFSSGTESSLFPWTGWSPLMANFITKMGIYIWENQPYNTNICTEMTLWFVGNRWSTSLSFGSFIYLLQDFTLRISKKNVPMGKPPQGSTVELLQAHCHLPRKHR
jgi:hypothetical protein